MKRSAHLLAVCGLVITFTSSHAAMIEELTGKTLKCSVQGFFFSKSGRLYYTLEGTPIATIDLKGAAVRKNSENELQLRHEKYAFSFIRGRDGRITHSGSGEVLIRKGALCYVSGGTKKMKEGIISAAEMMGCGEEPSDKCLAKLRKACGKEPTFKCADRLQDKAGNRR